MDLIQRVKNNFIESVKLKTDLCDQLAPLIVSAAEIMTNALFNEKKILSCGNGGSAADAQHFSSEMLNRFELERPGLPALALLNRFAPLDSLETYYLPSVPAEIPKISYTLLMLPMKGT